jgi:hypothetical protein
MGFPPAEVAAELRALLAAEAFEEDVVAEPGGVRFRARDVEITVAPLPPGRSAGALFQPRTLLVMTGSGSRAERLQEAIRRRFLRVMG